MRLSRLQPQLLIPFALAFGAALTPWLLYLR